MKVLYIITLIAIGFLPQVAEIVSLQADYDPLLMAVSFVFIATLGITILRRRKCQV